MGILFVSTLVDAGFWGVIHERWWCLTLQDTDADAGARGNDYLYTDPRHAMKMMPMLVIHSFEIDPVVL